MASLNGDICSRVSHKYHRRVKEIVSVLDYSVPYTIHRMGNLAIFTNFVKSLLEDKDGYELLDASLTRLNGDVIEYPTLKLSGPFIMLLVKQRLLNPSTGKDIRKNHILICETEGNESTMIRGAV